jgi:hypothetical protein
MAMKEGYDGIGKHQVCGDCVELPEGIKALTSHWVYKIKCNGAGNVQQFKARLVSGGNHRFKSIDYQATYSLAARLGQVRLALSTTTRSDLEIHQIAVYMAFLGLDLEDGIYMHQPQGDCRFLQTGSR